MYSVNDTGIVRDKKDNGVLLIGLELTTFI